MDYLKERIRRIMYGRNGMDEFSKFLFVVWAIGSVLAFIFPRWIGSIGSLCGSVCRIAATVSIIMCFVRAFSRNIPQRSAENALFLQWFAKQKQKYEAYKGRKALSKEYRFYKCPNCGTYVRIPRGKGKVHIKCKCGYVLYRKS